MDDAVRAAQHGFAVFEGRGLSLVGVADDVALGGGL
jgi:hypothetical protein